MRILMLHVDYFKSVITEKGRSRTVEEFNNPEVATSEALIVLSSVEKEDEKKPEIIATKTAEEISKLASQLKVKTIVLHPFAHLFGDLSRPEVAVDVLKMTQKKLLDKGFEVIRSPFGWFNTLEIKAKGHPISRVARIIKTESENR